MVAGEELPHSGCSVCDYFCKENSKSATSVNTTLKSNNTAKKSNLRGGDTLHLTPTKLAQSQET